MSGLGVYVTDHGLARSKKPAEIDGVATAGETPVTVAHYLGLTPKWVDGTAVGGGSFMIHVRHTAAAIASGLCKTVLITHGESGRSGVGRTRNVVAPTSLADQFEQPYRPMGPPTLFTIPVLRYMKTYGLTHEQLAMVSVVQREWAAKNPRATFRAPITVEDVLNSRMIASPFRLLQCCLVTDGGSASTRKIAIFAWYAVARERRGARTGAVPVG
jgi:acetyl-CoA acetyltransferase